MIILQPRDLRILAFVAEHYTVTTEHVWKEIFPENLDNKVVRRRLGALVHEDVLNATRPETKTLRNNVYCPVFYPSRKGLEILALETGEMKWLRVPTKPPFTQHLGHFLVLTDLRLIVGKAVAAQQLVALDHYYNQFDMTNPESEEPSERFRLHTTISKEPRQVVCVPDAAFNLGLNGVSKAFYLELENGGNPPAVAARKKAPGYAGLFEKKLHQRHFPGAVEEFTILMVAPHEGWRKELQREFSKKPQAKLYKFAARKDLTPETFLFHPVWHTCAGECQSLILLPRGAETARESAQVRAPAVPEAR
jgi:hypothetical protein